MLPLTARARSGDEPTTPSTSTPSRRSASTCTTPMKPVPTTAARSSRRSGIARRSYEVRSGGVTALAGKAALVTGAAGGIGGAVVRAFAGAGAQVLAVDKVQAAGEDAYVSDLTRAAEA